MRRIRVIKAIDGVTATTTSDKYYIGGATRVGLMFRRADHSLGATALSAKISLQPLSDATGSKDSLGRPTGGAGVTVTACNMLIDNVANTNGQTLTRVASKSLGANGDAFLWIDPLCLANWIELTLTETTDGTHSAWLVIEDEQDGGA